MLLGWTVGGPPGLNRFLAGPWRSQAEMFSLIVAVPTGMDG